VMHLGREGGGFRGGLVFCLRRRHAEGAEERNRWEQKQRAQEVRWAAHAAPIIVPRAEPSAGR
jgi:hypothetical protein